MGVLATVSVVIPVHNRAALVSDAVESVLTQHGVDVDIVVVNDGSTDHSGEVADALAAADKRVRVVHQDNVGPAAARNTGVALTTGQYLTFVDSDDLMASGRLASQVAAMERVGPGAVVLGEEDIFVAPGVTPPPLIAARLGLPRPHWYTMTFMTTRDLFDRVGGFNETFLLGEDTELLYRMKRHGATVARFEHIWTHRRIFGDNIIYDDEAVRRAGLWALRANLADSPPDSRPPESGPPEGRLPQPDSDRSGGTP